MRWIAGTVVALVALEHLGFLVLEMFYWTKPLGLRVFHTDANFAASSAVLAANQGLYNGFLAAGLLWSLFSKNGFALKVFFLSCVAAAGLYGGYTANPSIYYVQAAPGALALFLVLLFAWKRDA